MVSSKAINGSAQIWRENRRHHQDTQHPPNEDPPGLDEFQELPDTNEAEIEDVQKLLEETDSDLANVDEDSGRDLEDWDPEDAEESESESETEGETMTEEELTRMLADEEEDSSASPLELSPDDEDYSDSEM